MFTVALIGGIGSGKSTVSRLLAGYGAISLNLDEIGHRVLLRQDVRDELSAAFGPQVIGSDGWVDRSNLADAAFSSGEGVERLNAITHPRIWEQYRAMVERLPQQIPFVITEVTSGNPSRESLSWADLVVVVHAPAEVRRQRAIDRGLSAKQVDARMAVQPSDEEFLALADLVVDNTDDAESLAPKVAVVVDEIMKRKGA